MHTAELTSTPVSAKSNVGTNTPVNQIAGAGTNADVSVSASVGTTNSNEDARGLYFAKKSYVYAPLPTFTELRTALPSPILDERPEWIAMYWKAWEIACRNFNQPAPGSGFVSLFIDAAFNENIFLWDTCFMSMFCNVAHPLVPGIQSLDNFYARQHANGEISREIVRATGEDYICWTNRERRPLYSSHGWNVPDKNEAAVVFVNRETPQPPPHLTLDALNNPLCAWAEMESYRVTGDVARLALVYPALERYYRALQHYLRQGNGLYLTDWASMDNSPRNRFLAGGGCAVDTSAQMVLFARNLADIARILGRSPEENAFATDAKNLSRLINDLLWDSERQFYFDLAIDGTRSPVKTVAAFWPLLAGVANSAQADALCAELKNPATFGRHHRVPTLAANEPGYDTTGGYWCGAVWSPTTTMVLRGLEQYGRHELAREIALNDLTVVGNVFQNTGTLWENYAPDSDAPGKPAQPDFVGWSGITPIQNLLEHAIGLKADAPTNTLTWTLHSATRSGCERYRFNGNVVSLIAEPFKQPSAIATDSSVHLGASATAPFSITVTSDHAFSLRIKRNQKTTTHAIQPGIQHLAV